MIYPDLSFVLSLLIPGEFTDESSQMLRDIPHPLTLSEAHRLQVENGMMRALLGSTSEESGTAREGMLLWTQYLHEQVFVVEPFNLDSAFQQAAAWNADFQFQPPRWGLLLHPAIALERNATFLSFNPALRKCAKQSGLSLLPERL